MSVDKSAEGVLKLIKEKEMKFVDFRFTDTKGKEQHISVSTSSVDQDLLKEGKPFDGSSIAGWKSINQSDMLLMPDLDTCFVDPFYEESTLVIRCDVLEPNTMVAYERDPRSLAKRAEDYLKASGIADTCYFGPEPEFFIFDDVRWRVGVNEVSHRVDSQAGVWNSNKEYPEGNMGHRPGMKGGYFPVPPVDSAQDIRSTMSLIMEELGLKVEAHHHEVATGGQQEINTRFNTLLKKADELQIMKYVIHNVAHAYGKTATFMPKPVIDDNGSGMHCHQSLFKSGRNIFSGDKYAGLSDEALFYIGGIIKHAKALNAFTNPATNSYKRLVPGFEAPVLLAYSARNRSAAIRIPYVSNPKGRRIEVRFPDAMANPYLAFSAMLMAGIDGIKNKIHPGDAMDKNLYDLPPEEQKNIATVSGSLEEAVKHLKTGHQFLLEGGVFTKDLIEGYINLKQVEINRLKMTTHPLEFELYYSL